MLKRIRNLYAKYSSGNYASPMQVEKAEYSFYLQYLQEGMTVFDVGANIGELSLLFSGLVGQAAKCTRLKHRLLHFIVSNRLSHLSIAKT